MIKTAIQDICYHRAVSMLTGDHNFTGNFSSSIDISDLYMQQAKHS